jgi:hypothetical protein
VDKTRFSISLKYLKGNPSFLLPRIDKKVMMGGNGLVKSQLCSMAMASGQPEGGR